VRLIALGQDEVRLDLLSETHPLDPESYPLIDRILLGVDDVLGILSTNGSPKEWWRMFRCPLNAAT
jgi:hypothetical protein